MKIKVFGTRGGVPSPSRDKTPGRKGFSTSRYGGDTTHLRFEFEGKKYFIDGGSGIVIDGDELLDEGIGTEANPLDSDIFVSHYHWDHVQGFPFFGPFHILNNIFRIYGMGNSSHVKAAMIGGSTGSVRHIDCVPGEDNTGLHFPVAYDETQVEGDSTPVMRSTREHFNIYNYPPGGPVGVRAILTKHPDGCLAFRFYAGGKSFVYGGDHEFGLDRNIDRNLADLCSGADIIIMDTQHTPDEYEAFRGWGHSHYGQVISFAKTVGVKRVGMTHHYRKRSDDQADQFFEEAKGFRNQHAAGLDIFMLQQGMEIEV